MICRKSLSEVVRDALAERDAEAAATPRIIPFMGIVSGGAFQSAEEMDAYLTAHWPADIERGWAD